MHMGGAASSRSSAVAASHRFNSLLMSEINVKLSASFPTALCQGGRAIDTLRLFWGTGGRMQKLEARNRGEGGGQLKQSTCMPAGGLAGSGIGPA